MTPGAWVLLAATAVALAVGLLLRVRDGRVRTRNTRATTGVDRSVLDKLPEEIAQPLRHRVFGPGGQPEEQVTLLQFSTTFCAPCRHARILLSGFAERTPGLRHVEIDLTHHPEWSTPLGVHRTPTTLAIDAAGRELFRVGGVPRREELAEALRSHLP